MEFLCVAPTAICFTAFLAGQAANRKIRWSEFWAAMIVLGILALAALGSEFRDSNVENLVNAAANGDVAQTKWLLAHGADPNEPTDDEAYALQMAVVDNHPDVVRLLLTHGADPNIPVSNDEQRSLTRYAANTKEYHIFRMLKAAGGTVLPSN